VPDMALLDETELTDEIVVEAGLVEILGPAVVVEESLHRSVFLALEQRLMKKT
jgi:hypothetical protein